MRVVLQRVRRASVEVDGNAVGKIKNGLLVLLGISEEDSYKDAAILIRKTLNAKLWDGTTGKAWDASVMDKGHELLIVSQFTLYGSVKKKNKPDFHAAMKNKQARIFFEEILEMFRLEYDASKIQTGTFGEHMDVELLNDGPVTIQMDSSSWNINDVPDLKSFEQARQIVASKFNDTEHSKNS